MKRPNIVNSVRQKMHRHFPDAEVILFGSEARGDARRDSDIDLLVLLNQEQVTFADKMAVIGSLEDISLKENVEISPIIYTKMNWQQRPTDYFKMNINREGIKL